MNKYQGAFTSGEFWGPQLYKVRLIILVGGVLALIATVRLAKVALRLFRHRKLPQGIYEGTAAPLEIASFALSTPNLAYRLALNPPPSNVEDSSSRSRMQHMLHEADVRFSYLWEECVTDIRSIKNTAILLVLLSFLGVSFQTASALIHGPGMMDRLSFFVIAAFEIAAWLQVGLTVAATLFFLASLLERELRRRRTEWVYRCAGLRIRLDSDQPWGGDNRV